MSPRSPTEPGRRLRLAGQRGLLGLLAFVPFQLALMDEAAEPVQRALRSVDELALIGLGAIAVVLRIRCSPAPRGERALAIAASAFVAWALVSALVNGIGWWFFALGTAAYLKGLASVWIAAVVTDDRLADRVLMLIRWIAAVAALWALIEMVIGTWWWVDAGPEARVRFGLWRPSGPMGHHNHVGLYCILALILELAVAPRPSRPRAILDGLGAAVSTSRMVAMALIVVGVSLVRRARWLIVVIAAAAALLVASAGDTEHHLIAPATGALEVGQRPVHTFGTYRAAGWGLGLEVVRERPLTGVGPGRFGGVVAFELGSPVHEQHPFEPRYRELYASFRSLDVFYPQLLAELGAVGALLFAALGATLFTLLVAGWRRRRDPWCHGAALALLVVPIYLLGSGLNVASYLITTSAVCGIALAGQRQAPG